MEELRQRDRERYLLGAPPGPMSLNELRRLYGMEPVEMTAFGDTERSYIVPSNYLNTISNSSNTVSSSTNTVFYDPRTYETNYSYKWDNGRVIPVPVEAQFISPTEFLPTPETPEAWLRRRVAEICWTPT